MLDFAWDDGEGTPSDLGLSEGFYARITGIKTELTDIIHLMITTEWEG
jgi:hypothetical protein